MTTSGQQAADELLDRCLDYMQRTGFSHLSLREIAAGAGTSHPMILYHFGSREGLLAAAVARIEATQRAVLAQLADEEGDLVTLCREFWRRISEPELAGPATLFYEIYVQAVRGREWTAGFRDAVMASWEETLRLVFRRAGFTPAQSRKRARLALATARGLLLDLLLTGDRRGTAAAGELFAELVARP